MVIYGTKKHTILPLDTIAANTKKKNINTSFNYIQ